MQKRFNEGIFRIRHFLPTDLREEISAEKVGELLSLLSETEREVLEKRFGLDDGKQRAQARGAIHSFAQIGASMGFSRQRAYQLCSRAIHKIILHVKKPLDIA